MSALKPCPKCNGEAALVSDTKRWYVICHSCGVTSDEYKDKRTALFRWNNGILYEPILKFCPFCNGEAILHMPYKNTAWLECSNCGAYTPLVHGEKVYERVVELWETRPREDALRTVLENLVQVCLENNGTCQDKTEAISDACTVLSVI